MGIWASAILMMLTMMTKKRQGRARLAVDGTPITICTTTTVPSHLVIIIIITINLFIIFHYHEDHIKYSQPNNEACTDQYFSFLTLLETIFKKMLQFRKGVLAQSWPNKLA